MDRRRLRKHTTPHHTDVPVRGVSRRRRCRPSSIRGFAQFISSVGDLRAVARAEHHERGNRVSHKPSFWCCCVAACHGVSPCSRPLRSLDAPETPLLPPSSTRSLGSWALSAHASLSHVDASATKADEGLSQSAEGSPAGRHEHADRRQHHALGGSHLWVGTLKRIDAGTAPAPRTAFRTKVKPSDSRFPHVKLIASPSHCSPQTCRHPLRRRSLPVDDGVFGRVSGQTARCPVLERYVPSQR